MIDLQDQQKIVSVIKDGWKEKCLDPILPIKFKGKEIGQSIASFVDETNVGLLKPYYAIFQELHTMGKDIGQPKKRSCGDMWILLNLTYWPINTKTGIFKVSEDGSVKLPDGQPNITALKKLLYSIYNNEINAYYILLVKFAVSHSKIEPMVYFADLLDIIYNYVSFDAGPGQLMLHEKEFYHYMDHELKTSIFPSSNTSFTQKMDRLEYLYHDGIDRLLKNRLESDNDIRKMCETLRSKTNLLDQAGMSFRKIG